MPYINCTSIDFDTNSLIHYSKHIELLNNNLNILIKIKKCIEEFSKPYFWISAIEWCINISKIMENYNYNNIIDKFKVIIYAKYTLISYHDFYLSKHFISMIRKNNISEEKIKYILYLHTPKCKTCKYINDKNFRCPCSDVSKSKYYYH